jgi:hypothetical protein
VALVTSVWVDWVQVWGCVMGSEAPHFVERQSTSVITGSLATLYTASIRAHVFRFAQLTGTRVTETSCGNFCIHRRDASEFVHCQFMRPQHIQEKESI